MESKVAEMGPLSESDIDVTDETDNVPATEPEVEEEAEAEAPIADPEKFAKLVQAVKELSEAKVASQIGKMVEAGILPPKERWMTPRRHQVARMAMERCQDMGALKRQWPLIRFLRGDSLGNPVNEIKVLMSMAVIGVLIEVFLEEFGEDEQWLGL